MKKSSFFLGSAFLIFVLVMLGATGRLSAAEAVLSDLPLNVGISSMPSIGSHEIRAQLSPQRYTTVAAEIAGKIELLPVPEGERFEKNQELLQFDCTLHRAQLEKARAAQFAAEQTYLSNQRLFELNSVGKLELDVSNAEFSKAKAEADSSAAIVQKCVVVAPYGGRVAEQKVREQQYVQPGQALLEILDDSVLEFEFIAPSRWISWVKPGRAFRVRIDETGKSYPAKILRVGAKVDPVSQSVKMVGAIDGSFPELVAGMGGRVSMSGSKGKK